MGRKRGNAKRRKQIEPTEYIRPTPEQQERADYESAGMAYRRIAPIDALYAEHRLTQRQYDGLKRYADIAIACDRSELPDSLSRLIENKGFGGGGDRDGMSLAMIRANVELGRLERALGGLVDIARVVCIRERSLAEWAADRHGTIMREARRGKYGVRIWFEPRKEHVKQAWLDIRMAGEWLAAEIGA